MTITVIIITIIMKIKISWKIQVVVDDSVDVTLPGDTWRSTKRLLSSAAARRPARWQSTPPRTQYQTDSTEEPPTHPHHHVCETERLRQTTDHLDWAEHPRRIQSSSGKNKNRRNQNQPTLERWPNKFRCHSTAGPWNKLRHHNHKEQWCMICH